MSSRRPAGSSSSGSSKLRMDRQPAVARISDPSLPIGRRKEIDNAMKKARGSSNGGGGGTSGDYWDKKLLDIEEKDPNRWRHSGFKKMYLDDSDSDGGGRARERGDRFQSSREEPSSSSSSHHQHHRRPRSPRSPPPLPPQSSSSSSSRRRSPPPPHHNHHHSYPSDRDRDNRRRSPPPPPMDKRGGGPSGSSSSRSGGGVPSSRRPPSPPPKFHPRHRSKSSDSSYSGDGYNHHQHAHHPPSHHPAPPPHRSRGDAYRSRSRSVSIPRSRAPMASPRHNSHQRSAPASHRSATASTGSGSAAVTGKTRHIPLESLDDSEDWKRHGGKRSKKSHAPEDPRLARQQAAAAASAAAAGDGGPSTGPGQPPGQSSGNGSSSHGTKHKRPKGHEKLRARVKIEGEKRRKRVSSSESEDSSSSESADESIPTFAATTRMTLSERFGKMAQWSADRSNMDNLKTMRITKDSAGGPLKVMIEEQDQAVAMDMMEPPPRREYSPAPVGHFPEELALTAPSGLMSWDDVRVRYEYYKTRGYLRDLDLQDYVKWEEWWYKYQEWLKQERYYEFWERQQLRRRRKKVPIAQRLN